MKCVKSPWRHSSTVSYASVVSLAAISNTRPSFKNVCKTFLNLPCLPHILKCTKYSGYHKTCTLQIVHSKYVLFIQTSTMPKYLAGKGLILKLNSKGIPCNLLIMQKTTPFYPVCLPVASRYAVCLRFTFWSTRHGPCAELASQSPSHKNLLLPFFPLRPLPHESPSGQKAQIVQPHYKKKKKNSASFQPHPIPKTKCFV